MGKKALLVGCNYPGTEAQLSGCANDVFGMKNLLTTRFGFLEPNIKIQLDTDPKYPKPTGHNIKAALDELCMTSQPGDILVFHYSGHGTQVPQQVPDGTEVDGKDEAIVPTDMNLIIDEDLRSIVNKCPDGVQFTMISDCCHSGGMLDSPEIVISGEKALDVGIPVEHAAGRDLGDLEVKNRDLPLQTVMNILSQQSGHAVTLSNLQTTLSGMFGADASLMAKKFVGILEGFQASGKAGKYGPILGQIIKLVKSCAHPQTQADQGFKPPPGMHLPPDRCVLITGCQSSETSADACPSGNKAEAFGALSNGIQTILAQNPGKALTNKELVVAVRSYLAKGRYSQNPCLECTPEKATSPFIC